MVEGGAKNSSGPTTSLGSRAKLGIRPKLPENKTKSEGSGFRS